MKLAEKIRFLRLKYRLKQADLANALQVSPQAVSKWEKGDNAPDLFLLVKLAAIFGVTTDYLLGSQDGKPGVFEATVFCSSLKGFARESALTDSKRLAERTNVIFHHLTEAALRHGGVPVKYVGDGFLAFFSGAGHADRAADAAVDAQKTVRDASLVIMLNSGEIYLGSIGHPDYASRDICGEPVNLAFLISDWTAKNISSGIGLAPAAVRILKKRRRFGLKRAVSVRALRSKVIVTELKWDKEAKNDRK